MPNNMLKPKNQHNAIQDLLDMYTNGILTASGNTFTSTDLEQLRKMLGLQDSLTIEEKQELEQLKAQYIIDVKAAKLNIFKKQGSELRQYVMNSFIWQETVYNMNNAKPPQDPRIAELENKSAMSSYPYLGKSNNVLHQQDSSGFIRFPYINLPEGITIEDLQQAHMEATLEEEMLNGQES